MQPDSNNSNVSKQNGPLEANEVDLETANGGSFLDAADLAKFGEHESELSRSESVFSDISNKSWDGIPETKVVPQGDISILRGGESSSEIESVAQGKKGLTKAQKAAIAGGVVVGGGAVGGGIYGLVDHFKNKDKGDGK